MPVNYCCYTILSGQAPRGERWRMKSHPLQPANRSVAKDWEAIVHSIPKNAKLNTQIYLKSMSYAHRPYLMKHQALAKPIVTNYMMKMMAKNQISVAKGMADMTREVNAVINRRKK